MENARLRAEVATHLARDCARAILQGAGSSGSAPGDVATGASQASLAASQRQGRTSEVSASWSWTVPVCAPASGRQALLGVECAAFKGSTCNKASRCRSFQSHE